MELTFREAVRSDLLHPGTKDSRQLWAYTSPYQRNAADELKKLRFQVYGGAFDADGQLTQDVMEECQKNPNKTVLVLVADDGNYIDLLRRLKEPWTEAGGEPEWRATGGVNGPRRDWPGRWPRVNASADRLGAKTRKSAVAVATFSGGLIKKRGSD